jgi:3-hydroxyisobutyrate dehydrogenase-like beta-hydroxyacid dehydrogenase
MVDIGLLGFGEAAQAFATGWQSAGGRTISAFDIKISYEQEAERIRQACERLHVLCAADPREAVAGRDMVFSLVTADKALEAARQASRFIEAGTLYLDCNSCAPTTKRAASQAIEDAGGLYVDVAVMAPVHPALHRTPLLLSGPHARKAEQALAELEMNRTVAGNEVGQASATKMLRSVMIKGMEALTAECLIAARRAGVEQAVLASLASSGPKLEWTKQAEYNLERMIRHGTRRAAEMREVVSTIRDLGLPRGMSEACSEWQEQIGELKLEIGESSLDEILDRIIEKFSSRETRS